MGERVKPSSKKERAFWVGIGLQVSSFGVLLFYLTIPFLPLSPEAMMKMLVRGWIVSWGLFGIGTYLAGKEGYVYLRRRVRRWLRKP